MLLILALLFGGPAQADPQATRDAFDRLEEVLELRIDDGQIPKEDVLPVLIVEARPRYEASTSWFATRGIEVLERAFGRGALRLCEACMVPRTRVVDGALVYQNGPMGLAEIIQLDEELRGVGQPARTAVWLEEHPRGVSMRMIDLRNGHIVFAQNIDPDMLENARSERAYQLAAELERRAEGNSLTQGFFDVGVYPGQHVSLDWADQFGERNRHIAGVTLSLFDPFVGLGANYAYATPLLNSLVGAKVIVSVPTALARAIGGNDIDIVDPIVTGVATLRVPLGRTNYGLLMTASTNGRICFGFSLLNFSTVPILP